MVLFDIAAEQLAKAVAGIEKNLERQAKKGAIPEALVGETLGRIKTTQDMADLAAFYSGQTQGRAAPAAVEAPPAHVAELMKKANCASCHGEGLNKPIDPTYPKLAGQHADYVFVALKAYKTTNNANVGRGNAIKLLAEALRDLAAHTDVRYVQLSSPSFTVTADESMHGKELSINLDTSKFYGSSTGGVVAGDITNDFSFDTTTSDSTHGVSFTVPVDNSPR